MSFLNILYISYNVVNRILFVVMMNVTDDHDVFFGNIDYSTIDVEHTTVVKCNSR